MSGTKGVENPMQRLVESARRVVSKECSLVLSDSDRLSVLQWIPASVFADFMATKADIITAPNPAPTRLQFAKDF
jgi:hypothetical protein